MRKLMIYIHNYKKEAIIAPLFKMLEASFELLIPIIMAGIIDTGIGNKDVDYIWKMSIVMICFGIFGLICSLTAQYYAAKASAGFGTELRRDFYAHVNSLSYRELDDIGTATLVTRITSDINQVQSGVNLVLRLLLRAPFIVVGAVVMAFTISIRLTVIFLVAVPLLGIAIYLMVKMTIPIYKDVQKALDKVVSLTRENYTGARVVRAFARQDDEKQDFYEAGEVVKKRQIRAGKIAGLMNPVTYLMVNLAIICILWTGGLEVYHGGLTQGQVVALISYMTQILLALLALAVLVMSVTKALASAVRVNEIFARKATLFDTENQEQQKQPDEPLIVFDHVDFSYEGAADMTLSDISFSVMPGETVGVIGGTGSGKSTLMQLLPRFYDASSGCVQVEGNDVKTYPFKQLRQKIGVVPQKAVLFTGTIRQNMRWGLLNATDEEIYEALSIAQAKEFVEDKAGGLDAKVLAGGKNFSGGQKQRLTIARALVRKPDILILDDSSSALDYATDAALRKALRENTQEMTVFLVSQRVSTVKQADRILVLDDGKIVGTGTHEELWETCEIYQEICLSQLKYEEVVG